MNAANLAFHALQGVARSVERRQPASVDLGRAVADFCGQDATKFDRLASIGSKLSAAKFGYGRFDTADLKLLRAFLDSVEGDLAMSDFTVPDDKPDTQHSPDESHFLDRERI